MRKHTEYLLARAKTAREWGNADMAIELKDRAARFEAREPMVSKYISLKSEAGAGVMAYRIERKLDNAEIGEAVEPGYDPDVWRVFYDWNKAEKLGKAVESLNKLGCPIEAEWSDEWIECSECGRYVRSQPNSYSWMRSFYVRDSDAICHECVEANPDEYIEWLAGEPKRANTILSSVVLEELGWKCFAERQESGLHGGQAKEPAKIARWLRERNVPEFIFNLECVGQFDSEFSVWVRQECELTLPDDESEWNGVDPAEIAKAMLRSH